MRIFYNSIIFLSALLLLSCSELQFPEFQVNECTFNENQVNISFTNPPNQYLFLKSFSLKENSEEVKGMFVFDENLVTFIPNDGIKNEYYYELKISTDAEDENGNSLEYEYTMTYTTRSDFDRPVINSITPNNESNIDNQVTEIKIEFSKPININTFNTAFSINPSIEYLLNTENDDSTIIIIPTEPLKKETRYDIKISTKLTDKHYNNLLNDFKSTFINFHDTQKPTYKLFVHDGNNNIELSTIDKNENISKNAKLEIYFDKQIDINYIASYIEIFPEITLTITPDRISKNKTEISFSNNVNWNTEYNLKILKGLKDLCNNEITEDQNFTLLFNNENDRPVTLNKVLIDLKKENQNYDEITNYCTKTFDVAYFPTNDDLISTNIYAIFNISNNANSISLISVMNAINMEYTNSCFSSITTKTVKILNESQINNDSKLKPIYDSINLDGGKLCVVQFGIELINSNTTNIGMLILSFDKDIKDDLGNTLGNDIKYHINKQ